MTRSHRRRLGTAWLSAFFFSTLATAQGVIQSNATGNWSNPATWTRLTPTGGASTPAVGDTIKIQATHTVTLDTNSGIQDLAKIEILGTLTVADTQAYTLGVNRIDVGSATAAGVLRVGSVTTPFVNTFRLQLRGNRLPVSYGATDEAWTLQVHQGSTLALVGNPKNAAGQTKVSWLRLKNGADVLAGSTAMTLEAPPNWAVGDQVVITATDFDFAQAEQRALSSVSFNTVGWTTPVLHHHNGDIELGLVDERAEVGLLSHNIVVEGVVDPAGDPRRGGHVHITNDHASPSNATAPQVTIAQVEFTSMGWYGAMGRYPLHFHHAMAMPGSLVQNCSIHHCFCRAIALHASHDLTISDNVVFETFGHAVYIEDGSERRNSIVGNLALSNRKPTAPAAYPLLQLGQTYPVTGQPFFSHTDVDMSTYWLAFTPPLNILSVCPMWITVGFEPVSDNNSCIGNVAAGSEGHGFWYHSDISPPLVFDSNTAHSNEEHGFSNSMTLESHWVVYGPTPSNRFQVQAVFNDFSAWKNRHGGIWFRAFSDVVWERAVLADNLAGAYLASEGALTDAQMHLRWLLPGGVGFMPGFDFLSTGAPSESVQVLHDSIIVGTTNNQPGSPFRVGQPWLEQRGVELYDGLILIDGCQFMNFNSVALPAPVTIPGLPSPITHRVACAISSRGRPSESVIGGNRFALDPRNEIRNSTFVNVMDPVLFPIQLAPAASPPNPAWANPGSLVTVGNGDIMACLFDADGSITGVAGQYVVNNTPLLAPPGAPSPSSPPHAALFNHPLAVDGPGLAGDMAYGSIFLRCDAPSTLNCTKVTFTCMSAGRAGDMLDVFDANMSDAGFACGIAERWFQTNLLLSHGGSLEEYDLSFPSTGTPPTSFTLRLRFSEVGREAFFAIPFARATGPTVTFHSELDPSLSVPGTSVASAALVKAGSGTDFHWNGSTLFVKLRLVSWPWLALGAISTTLTGREVVMKVQ